MIRLSLGTAACLGLSSSRPDTGPTTAYLLLGENCLMHCAFCSQGGTSPGNAGRLGRVTWPLYPWPEAAEALQVAALRGMERVCLQAVRHPAGITPLLDAVARIRDATPLPVSVSAWVGDLDEAAALFRAGIERLGIALDLACPRAYARLKGGSQRRRLNLLLDCADAYPGRLSTHLICGLGESEEQLLYLADQLLCAGVRVALFAFTPVRGTPLQEAAPPAADRYRRVQAGLYLLQNRSASFSGFRFEHGRLRSLGLDRRDLEHLLAGGEAFRTSGCPGCNRPFYNERPGGVLYNYPRKLQLREEKVLMAELFAALEGDREAAEGGSRFCGNGAL